MQENMRAALKSAKLINFPSLNFGCHLGVGQKFASSGAKLGATKYDKGRKKF